MIGSNSVKFRTVASAICIHLCLLPVLCVKDQVWRIIPEKVEELEVISDLISTIREVDVWRHPTLIGRPVDIRLSNDDMAYVTGVLHSNNIIHRVMIDDVSSLIEKHRQKRSSVATNSIENFNYEVYHPAHEIEEWLDVAAEQYSFVDKLQIGVTYEGRPIHALKIQSSGPGRPAIYVDSLIHCREWIAGGASLYAFSEILSNSSLSWMLEDLNWFFVPMINVDGYIRTWTSDRLWRKTNSDQATLRCQGTDANRNFDSHWDGDPAGSSIEPCSTTFRGPFPESESETRHIARFIRGNNDVIKAVVTVHSYAQMVIYPFNFAEGEYPTNNDVQNRTAAAMSEAMYAPYNTTYEFGPAAETLAVANGVTTDWTQEQGGIDINYTIELRDTGEYGFLLPEDQIIPTGEELLAGIRVLAEHVKAG